MEAKHCPLNWKKKKTTQFKMIPKTRTEYTYSTEECRHLFINLLLLSKMHDDFLKMHHWKQCIYINSQFKIAAGRDMKVIHWCTVVISWQLPEYLYIETFTCMYIYACIYLIIYICTYVYIKDKHNATKTSYKKLGNCRRQVFPMALC